MKKMMLIIGVMVLLLSTALAEETAVLDSVVSQMLEVSQSLPLAPEIDEAEIALLLADGCEHADYEMVDSYESVPFGVYQYNATHHRRAKKMTAICLNCFKEITIYVDSTFLPHNWAANGDVHLSGATHRYRQRCTDCFETTYYECVCLSCPSVNSAGIGYVTNRNVWCAY